MRARLVLDFGGTALDEHFQEVQRPLVDGPLGPPADRRDPLDQGVGRGLVADLAEHAGHGLQEGINLAGRMAHDRVGQDGQQAEVARGAVELSELIEVVSRPAGLLQQGGEGQQHFGVQLAGGRLLRAGNVLVIPLPGLELRVNPLIESIVVNGLEGVDAGPVVGVAAIDRHVPIGQGEVVGAAQLVGRGRPRRA